MTSDNDEIDLFDIHPPQIKYSKYANNLDRIFKDKSLGGLQYNLKNPKSIKIQELSEEFNTKANDKMDKYSENIMETYNNFQPKINSENNELKKKIMAYKDSSQSKVTVNTEGDKNDEITNHQHYIKKKLKRLKKTIFREIPDLGKYNPSYNHIEKKIPKVIFCRSENKSKIELKETKVKSEAKESKESNSNTDRIPIIQTKNSISFENKEMLENSINSVNKNRFHTFENQNTSNLYSNNKNNALRFSQYSLRKDDKQKKWHLPIISYLEPYDFTSKCKGIDFKKMKERNKNDLLNLGSLNNPSICYYEPKYDLVMKNSPRLIKFNHNDPKPQNKKYLVKKMWRSYNVSTEYKYVKLKSFSEENK